MVVDPDLADQDKTEYEAREPRPLREQGVEQQIGACCQLDVRDCEPKASRVIAMANTPLLKASTRLMRGSLSGCCKLLT